MTRTLVVAFLLAAVTVALLVLWRGFFVRHAIIIGLAVAALVYSVFRATERLKSLHRK